MSVPAVPDPLTQLRRAVARLADEVTELETAGDTDSLAWGVDHLARLNGDLRQLEREARQALARIMPAKQVEVDGLGVVERRRGSTRKAWDSDGLLEQLKRRAFAETEGDKAAALDVLEAKLRACVPFTASLGWRAGALRAEGLDPDEWCEASHHPDTVQIHKETRS